MGSTCVAGICRWAQGRTRPPRPSSQAPADLRAHQHLPWSRNPKRGCLGLRPLLTPLLCAPSPSPPWSCLSLPAWTAEASPVWRPEAEGWAWVVFHGPLQGPERGVSVRKILQSRSPPATGPSSLCPSAPGERALSPHQARLWPEPNGAGLPPRTGCEVVRTVLEHHSFVKQFY